jgi:hypothetical protein
MKALMTQSNELSINSDTFIELKAEKHAWTIKLGTKTFLPSLFSELKQIVSAIRDQMASWSPDGERGFAHLFSTCFEFSRFLSLKAQHLDGYGDAEICELIDTLSAPQATGRKFWCQVPFIKQERKNEVCSDMHNCKNIYHPQRSLHVISDKEVNILCTTFLFHAGTESVENR